MHTLIKRIFTFLLVFTVLLCSTGICNVFAEDILTFNTPFSYTENFVLSKSSLVSAIGTYEPYSQFVSAKYWTGEDISTITSGNGISFSTSKESISVSSLQPVYGSYIFDFEITHPEFNNLSSAIYIGIRSTEQFTDMTAYNLSDMPTDGVWLGISYNNAGIGSKLVSGNSSQRYTISDSFSEYTRFRVYDDRENDVIYYYALNDDSSFLFAKAELGFNYAEQTTTVNYTIYPESGEETYSVTVNGLLSDDSAEGVYPQLQMNKYLCELSSFGVTCEANEIAELESISITGAELSEDISLLVTDYTLKQPVSGTAQVTVTGNPGVKYEVYTDDEEIPMLYGENTVSLNEKSSLYIVKDNGAVQTTYTFKIIDNTHTVKVLPTYCTIEDADNDGTKTLVADYDGTVTFNIVPDAGYDFVSASAGTYIETTVNTLRTGVLTVENVTEDTEIDLIFERRAPIEITIGSTTAAQGETVDIPISISENSGAVAGSFNILYDNDRLDFLGSVTTGCLSLGNRELEVTSTPGKLGFYFISKNLGQTPLTSGGVLVYARFTVRDDASDGQSPIALIFEENDNFRPSINDWEGIRVVNATDGVITFMTPEDGKHILKTAVYDGTGGTVTPGTRMGEGEKITLKATASTGYEFSHWEAESGSFSSNTASSVTYTMGDSSTTVYAHFKLKTYTITTSVTDDEGGTISASADNVNYGGSVTVTMTPYPGYEISAFTVNNRDKLSSLENGVYTLTSIKAAQNMVVTYSWVGTDIVTDITPLRSYYAVYNNADRTITVKASNRNTSAGFALDIPGDETTGNYKAESAKNLSQGTTGGKKYIVARRSAGAVQNFELYITYEGIEYIYNVTFMFTEDPDSAGACDLATTGAYSATIDTIYYKANIIVDRYKADTADFAFVLPENSEASYEFISSTNGGTEFTTFTSSDYTSVNGVNYGVLEFISLPVSNGVTQKLKVTVTNGVKTNDYVLTVAFRDPSYEGNVRPSKLVPLRLAEYSIDTENKTIYAKANPGASSAGFSFEMSGNPPVKLTCKSGYGLAYGTKDGYRYVVSRRSYGAEQTYKVKLYGDDGYEYSWYTVTMIYN